ncbi:MAG: hypothetical protein JXB04_06655 [Kiritimatiellae bacterium]|nr:hypothetical protein [Kiritimatiellia bacterium]
MRDVISIAIWAAIFIAGLWVLKVSGAGSARRRRKAPVPRSQKILQAVGWTLAAAGGIGLALTFGVLFNRGALNPSGPFGM